MERLVIGLSHVWCAHMVYVSWGPTTCKLAPHCLQGFTGMVMCWPCIEVALSIHCWATKSSNFVAVSGISLPSPDSEAKASLNLHVFSIASPGALLAAAPSLNDFP